MAFQKYWFKRFQDLIGSTFTKGSLEVSGDTAQIKLTDTDTTGSGILLKSGNSFFITNEAAGALIFATNNSERIRIVSGGDVGIGGTPTEKFEVFGKIKAVDVNFSGLPTSATGLDSGDVWDNSGVLNIVA